MNQGFLNFDAPAPEPAAPLAASSQFAEDDSDWVHCYWWATKGGEWGDWWRALPTYERSRWLALYKEQAAQHRDSAMPTPDAIASHLQASFKNFRTMAVRWALEIEEHSDSEGSATSMPDHSTIGCSSGPTASPRYHVNP